MAMRCPLFEKIKTIATRIYRADDVAADMKIRNQLREFEAAGFGHLPICMAKTQYSFSTDPNLRGAPTGHIVPIREVRLSAGAGFIVVICGDIMTMPDCRANRLLKISGLIKQVRLKGCSSPF